MYLSINLSACGTGGGNVLYIAIISFPRCATTYVYNYLYKRLRNSNTLFIFEPFYPNTIYDIVHKGRVIHDEEGTIRHDFYRLPPRLRRLIYENAKWSELFLKDKQKYCGNYLTILNEFDKLPQKVIMKDICLWAYLAELARCFGNTHFIVLKREFEYLKQAFLKWYNSCAFKGRLKRSIEKIRRGVPLSRITHIRNVIRYLFATPEPLQYHFGLLYVYKHFKNEVPQSSDRKTFLKVLKEAYDAYVNIVDAVGEFDNCHVIEFGKRLSDGKIEKVVKEIVAGGVK